MNAKIFLTVKGIQYTMSLSQKNEKMFEICIIDRENVQRWLGNFNSDKVNEIVQRADSPKSFSVILKMLYSAMQSKTNEVSLNIVTPSDIIGNKEIDIQDHIFLILNYSSSFEDVAYTFPIPLFPFSNIELIEIIKNLREENRQLVHASGGVDQTEIIQGLANHITFLEKENSQLKEEMTVLTNSFQNASIESEEESTETTFTSEQEEEDIIITNQKNNFSQKQIQKSNKTKTQFEKIEDFVKRHNIK